MLKQARLSVWLNLVRFLSAISVGQNPPNTMGGALSVAVGIPWLSRLLPKKKPVQCECPAQLEVVLDPQSGQRQRTVPG
jgi:hypothetical protein